MTELCVASVHEDRYGLVFAALPVVLGTLARFKLALTLYSKASGSLTHKVVTQPRLVEAHDVVDGALYRITQAFYPEMARICVPNKVHAKIIQSFLDYAVCMSCHVLSLFLDSHTPVPWREKVKLCGNEKSLIIDLRRNTFPVDCQ